MKNTSTSPTLYQSKVPLYSVFVSVHPSFLLHLLFATDLVAIPDFQSGAMENWGLTTYRETSLLVDPHTSCVSDKVWVTMVIGHELAHQVRELNRRFAPEASLGSLSSNYTRSAVVW